MIHETKEDEKKSEKGGCNRRVRKGVRVEKKMLKGKRG